MRVVRNGKLLRTIPIPAGKPGSTTRSGVKVWADVSRGCVGMSTEAPGQPSSRPPVS